MEEQISRKNPCKGAGCCFAESIVIAYGSWNIRVDETAVLRGSGRDIELQQFII